MKKLSLVLGLLIVVGLSGFAVAQENVASQRFSPWVGVRGSYQAVFQTDLFDSESAFVVPRARVGVEGEWVEDLYFQVELDGRNTARGRGADLRVAFVRWNFLKNESMKNEIEFGAITTTFARGLSGTEYAFINYDICTVLDAYQYGIQYKGSFLDRFVEVFLSANNGEGLSSLNVANGLQYIARVEITPLGGDIKDLREGNTGKTLSSGAPMLTISVAGAMDNKARTDDYGYTAEYYSSYHALADLTFKIFGLSLFAQGVYNTYDAKEDGTYWGGADGTAQESYGGFGQIGYNLFGVIGLELEPMFKFEWWRDVINVGYGKTDYTKTDFAVGINWYIRDQDLKINAEFRRVLSDNNMYAVKGPADNYLGLRVTHKFGAKIPL